MNTFIVLTAVLTVALALPYSDSKEQEWENFKLTYDKHYQTPEEENLRKKIFSQNLKTYDEHNKKFEEGLFLHTLGVTRYADLTDDEYSSMFPRLNYTDVTPGLPYVPLANVEAPGSIDWRQQGAVTYVKDQGECGSCYTFSATGAIEGQLFRKTGQLVSLSEQNLVDCTRPYGNSGCKEGIVFKCYEYVQRNGGINTAASYPYRGVESQCNYNPQSSAGTINNYVSIPRGDEGALLNAVGTIGPVSVLVSDRCLKAYRGGVIVTPQDINVGGKHAILVVGYGTTPEGVNYWTIKNSYGSSFGESGYARIVRNQNLCGIANFATYPVV